MYPVVKRIKVILWLAVRENSLAVIAGLSAHGIMATKDGADFALPAKCRLLCKDDLDGIVASHVIVAVTDLPEVHIVKECAQNDLNPLHDWVHPAKRRRIT